MSGCRNPDPHPDAWMGAMCILVAIVMLLIADYLGTRNRTSGDHYPPPISPTTALVQNSATR